MCVFQNGSESLLLEARDVGDSMVRSRCSIAYQLLLAVFSVLAFAAAAAVSSFDALVDDGAVLRKRGRIKTHGHNAKSARAG